MRIAVVNSSDFAGGAETVARTLCDGLRDRGHSAIMWVGRRSGPSVECTRVIPCTDEQRQVARRFAEKGFFNLGLPSSDDFCKSSALQNVDLINLHNAHGHYLSMTSVANLARRAPLVWTLHDFFALTGGCAFPGDCDRWLSQCGSCPQLGQYPLVTKYDRTRRMQSIKRSTLCDLPTTIVTPSQHLARAVQRSRVFRNADLRTIPYGVDTNLFHPGRSHARRLLGLGQDDPIILVVAQGLDDPRKGIGYAVRAIADVDALNLVVLLLGAGGGHELVGSLGAHQVKPLGYVTDRVALARCYAAADLLVFTSLAENFPCVVQEAMACGTPVLAFDIDGVREQIESDRTGFLVPARDVNSLTQAARALLKDRARLAEVGWAARRHAEAHWTVNVFLDRHEQLFRDLITRRKRCATEVDGASDIGRSDRATALTT